MKKYSPPSNRSFGALFTGISIFLSVYFQAVVKDSATSDKWLVLGLWIGLVTMVAPALLKPFNLTWVRIGDLIGKVVSPVVLGVIFFALITPIALIFRFLGRDVMSLKRPNVSSYWIDRMPPGPSADSFKNQF